MLAITYKRCADLTAYARNSRTHSAVQIDQIARSIREFGFTNPLLIDGQSQIIAGHGRLLAAQKLGMNEVPCVELDHMSSSQKRAYVIADNKLALNAGWDEELLRLELADLGELGVDLNLIGFEDAELEKILGRDVQPIPGEDDVPETPVVPTTQPGDIWRLGQHRLMCGDSTVLAQVDLLMAGERADLLITDPPYNVAYEGGTKEALTIKNDSMDDQSFRSFLAQAFKAADASMKPGAVFYIWHADSEGFNFRAACKDAGWMIRQCLIWKKQQMVLGRQDYHWIHEPCLYGWKEGAAHLWAADRKQTTVLEFDRPSRNEEHPTMKPVSLIEYQLLNNTKGEDLVLDLFGGSGTTLIAAEKHGRKARVMELDPKYCDVIIKRWQKLTGQVAIHDSTESPFIEK